MVAMADTVTVYKLGSNSGLGKRRSRVVSLGLLLAPSLVCSQTSVSPPTTNLPTTSVPSVSIPSQAIPSGELPTTGGGVGGQVKKDELKFLPGVRSSLTYSSNLARTQGGSSGFVAEVSPYFEGAIDSDRTKAQVYATLRTFFRTVGGSSVSPDLRASGQTALIGDWLWISGNASIYSVASNPLSAVSFDPATANVSSQQFRQFQVSPYIQGRLGTFAEYQGRYSLATASSSTNIVLAKLDQRFSGSLKSGPQFNQWGWDLSGETQRRTYDGGVTQNRNSASAAVFIFPMSELRLGASVNFDQIDNFVVNGRTSGTGLGFSADWTPSNRTSLSASAKRLYYGTVGKLAATHRFGMFTGALSYDKSLLTSSDGSLLSVSPAALFSAGGFSSSLNPVFSQLASSNLVQTYATAVGGGVLSDFIILNNTLTFSMGYASPLNSLVLSATRARRNSDATRAQSTFSFFSATSPSVLSTINLSAFNTNSVSLDWTHNLDSKNSFGIRVSRVSLESVDAIGGVGNSVLNSIVSSYRTKLTADTSAIFGLRHLSQKALIPTQNFDETAVFGTIDVRF